MMSAHEALERLKNGNREFVSRMKGGDVALSEEKRMQLPQVQDPFAIVLGCSDARVPAEIVFNQGLGDLFMIRVAGNIVAPSQVGSVEFAAARYNAPLVVVLGHTQCGGILATIEALQNPEEQPSRDLLSIVNRVRPSVEPLFKTELRNDMDALVRHAVRANVAVSVNHLRHGSAMLEQMVKEGRLAVVGGEYSLETGEVEFFDIAGAE
jgi:carbonic anhydrase